MFRRILFLAIAVLSLGAASSVFAATTIDSWTNGILDPGIAASITANGPGTALPRSVISRGTVTYAAGANAYNSGGWNTGGTLAGAEGANDYIQITMNTTGFTKIHLRYTDQRGANGNGPANTQVEYSTTGGPPFTSLGAAGAFTPANGANNARDVDFSGIAAVDNNANVVVRIFGWNAANNGGTFQISSVSFETAAPTVVVTGPASPTNANPINFTLTFSEAVSGLTATAGDIGITNGTFGTLSGGPTVYTLAVNPTAQAAVTCQVKAGAVTSVATGFNNIISNNLSITYDSIVPTVSVTGPSSPTNVSPITFTLTFSEAVSGLTAGEITVGNGTKGGLSGGPTVYTIPVTPLSDAAVTCQVTAGAAQDSAGNNNTVSNNLSITFDSTPPTVSVTGPASPTTSSPITFTMTFNESVSTLTAGEITVTGGTKGALAGGPTVYTIPVTPTGQNAVTCQVTAGAAQDSAGNNNTVSNNLSIVFDTVAPTVIQKTPDNLAIISSLPSIAVLFSESVTGVVAGNLTVNGSPATGLTGGGPGNYVFTGFADPADGSVTIAINGTAIFDLAGTAAGAIPGWTYTKSSAAVTVTLSSPVGDGTLTNVSPVSFTATVSESVDNFNVGDIAVTNGSVGSFAGTGAGPYTFSVTPSGQGAVTVSIAAGVFTATAPPNNANAASSTYSFTYDSVAPVVSIGAPSLTLTQNGPIDFPITITGADTINLTPAKVNFNVVSGSPSGSISVQNGATASPTVHISGLTGDGVFTISIATGAASDTAGNNSAATGVSASVTVDNTGPGVTLDAPGLGAATNAPFTVNAHFTEDVTGFDDTDIIVTNGSTITGFGGSGADYTWTVNPTAQGAETVQVLVGAAIDGAGNTNTNSNIIGTNYDSIVPTVDAITPNPGAILSSLPSVSIHFDEPVFGVTPAALTVNGSAATGVSGSGNGNYVFTGFAAPADGTVTVLLDGSAIVDAAGNAVGTVPSWDYTKDSAAVTVTLASGTVSSGNSTNVSPISFTATVSQSVDNFDVTDISVTGGTAGNFAGTGAGPFSFDVTPSGQGLVTVSIAAGSFTATAPPNNPNAASSTYSFTYDTVDPTVAIGAPSATLTQNGPIDFPITVTGADLINLIPAEVVFNVVSGNPSGSISVLNGSSANPTVEISSLSGDGTFTISIVASVASDDAGNTSAAAGPSAVVTVDNTGPDVTLNAPGLGAFTNAPFNVSAHFTEAVFGFDASDISVSNGSTISGFIGSGADYSWTVNPTAQGAETVQVMAGAASDAAGNANNDSNSVGTTYDSIAPSIDQISPNPGTITNALPSVTIHFSEAVFSVAAGALTVNGSPATNVTGSGVGPYTFTGFANPADGTVTVLLTGSAIVDAAGNDAGSIPSWDYTKDSSAVTITLSSGAVSNGGSTSTSPIPFTATVSQSVDNFDVGDITVIGGSAGNFAGTGAGPFTFDVTPSGEGAVSVSIPAGAMTATAPPNNANVASSSYNFTYDTVAPTVTIGAPSITITNSGPVDFPITVTDADTVGLTAAGVVFTVVSGTPSGSISVLNGTSANPTVRVSSLTGDGSFTISIVAGVASDNAGNTSAAAGPSAGVTVDNTPPDVTLDSPGLTALINAPFTATATFSETVIGFNAATVTVSNGGTISNISGSGAGPYTFTVNPGAQGAVTVQILAGAITGPAGNGNTPSNIIATSYDSISPTVDQKSPAAGTTVNTLPSITIQFSESVNGVTAGALTVNGSAATNVTGSGAGPYVFTGYTEPPADGPIAVVLDGSAIVDDTGNSAGSIPWSYTKDTAAVTITLSSGVVSNGGATNVNPIPITATVSQSVDNFDVTDISVTGGIAGNFAGTGAGPFTFDVTPSGEGAVSVSIAGGTMTATAPPNNPNAASSSYNFTYDATVPTVSIGSPSASLTNTGPIDFLVTVTGADTINLSNLNVTLNPTGTVAGTVTVLNGATANPTVRVNGLTGDGTFTISVAASAASDNAGNNSAAAGPSASVTVDNTPPNVTLTSPGLGSQTNAPFTVSATFTDPVTVFSASSVTASNGATVTNVSGSGAGPYTFTVTPTAQGAVTVQVPAGVVTGPAGNGNTASNIISTIYDTIAPTIDQLSPNAGTIINALPSVTVHFDEAVSGVTADKLTVNGSLATGVTGSGVGPYVFTGYTPPADGTVTVVLDGSAIVDLAGNAAGTIPSWDYTQDSTAITVTLSSADISNGGTTNASPIAFTATVSQSVDNFAVGDVNVIGGTASNFAGTGAGPYTFDVTPSGQGAVSVSIPGGSFTATAPPNSPNVPSSSYNFTYDSEGPSVVIGSPSINLTVSGPVNFPVSITGATTISLTSANVTLTPTGTVAGTVTVLNGTTANPTVQISGLTGTGSFTISIAAGVAIDDVNNTSAAAGPSASVTVVIKSAAGHWYYYD